MLVRLDLYTTAHCTLCDRALERLLSIPIPGGCLLNTVDIATDDSLLERFGERIPVLRSGDAEFDGPFEEAEVLAWLNTIMR